MSLIDKVLDDPFYRAFADKVSEEKRLELEESIRELLQGAENMHSAIINASSSNDKKEELLNSIEHNISPEGVNSWQEKS
tara:strand:- start:1403 stop:1642 length:240 start_codon:yes stop_codon:yes gene_type:complete